nr:small integral membrane protein 5 isoform X2 [Macaca nemestrina]
MAGFLPLPSPSPDSLGFCAQTQRAPLTAGLGSVSLHTAWPAGWHNQANVTGPGPWTLEPCPDSWARSAVTAPAEGPHLTRNMRTTNNKKARQRQQLAVSRGAGLRRPGEQRHPAPTEEVRGQHVEAPRWGTAAQPPTPELPGVSLLGYTRLCRHSANQAENARPSAEREGRKAAELLNHAPTVP